MPGSFADSNVLLYLLSADERKRVIATELLSEELTISVQVLNEVTLVARRKHGLAWAQIRQFIDDLVPLVAIEPVTIEIHHAGRSIAERYGFRFYDSLIVAAALGRACTTLFSEDLNHGQRIGNLTITNPFV
ncbi:MAG TPA: PIN domain-containing protein [Devosia sp.]|nr:PIN domain-containing protein [Devosia sp.]